MLRVWSVWTHPAPMPIIGSPLREAEFVSDEVARLLESRAIELCANPKVVSPLAAVQGFPFSFDEKGEVDHWLRELKDRAARSFSDASASGLGVVV
ncbi:hypothetical protein PRIPAC_81904 [Pristionchus pacificus]|uniref:Uncharacterized protein n=1 Tax=Pristionchus pacificus TaxID=54126 RepID=A0A2A6CLN8_PRIPA|nr:hypothetical protein PRIPAC_81904 [Pristionchus pacificus]|eukprot:PDM79029.1 hypothetical protein PRIPAC_31608 [Pristionchus pacificus]